jgi:hypothetical protein
MGISSISALDLTQHLVNVGSGKIVTRRGPDDIQFLTRVSYGFAPSSGIQSLSDPFSNRHVP